MSDTIKYPNGKTIINNDIKNNTTKKKTIDLTKSKLGIDFEETINQSNIYYLKNNIAAIYKKPTPIQIVQVEYPSRNKARISEAYYKKPSTTDYNGIYKEKYIDFEAKSCKEMSFSFERIYTHQITHLETIKKMGGISFLIIEFSTINEIYILPTNYLIEIYNESKNGGRKSIPYDYFKEKGTKVERNIKMLGGIDYLKAVDIAFKI
mgnify:CR=1 FL=1